MSDHDKIIPMAKNVEMISSLFRLTHESEEFTDKNYGEMQKHAVNEEHFLQTTALLTEWGDICSIYLWR